MTAPFSSVGAWLSKGLRRGDMKLLLGPVVAALRWVSANSAEMGELDALLMFAISKLEEDPPNCCRFPILLPPN